MDEETPVKKKKEKRFLIVNNDGVFVCVGEDGLLDMLGNKGISANEVYLLDKKVASIDVIPGKLELLSGEKSEAKVDIKYV